MLQVFKKITIIILSDLVAVSGFLTKKILNLARPSPKRHSLRILLYHSVKNKPFYNDLSEENVPPGLFKKQMSILKESSRKVVKLREGLEALKEGDLLQDLVAVSFDDGTRDNYHEAVRFLEASRIPAVFFITYRYAQANGVALTTYEGRTKTFMGWDMIKSLKDREFEIGCHSYSHSPLVTLSDSILEREIVHVKQEFEKKGVKVDFFAYPYGNYGHFSQKTEERIREAGYKACFTSIMGDNVAGDNLFELKRTRVSWRDNPLRFRLKLEGAYDWVDTLKRKLIK